MAIRSPRYSFDRFTITSAPTVAGVFWLWDGDEIVFIGRTTGRATIKSCIADHCAGDYGECTRRATHYGWEMTLYPATRERELLDEFAAENNQPPRCMRA